jgi:sugar phosphate isomerase/epimerase
VIGANFDPSHLIWQGMDPVAAIRELAGAIYHVHAKDTKIDGYNVAKNGVLDTKHYSDELHRAWVFRTVGYGNGESYWRDLVSNLRLCGYDRVLSIEHEDSLMTIDEGLCKAVDFLKGIIIEEAKPTTMSWA